LGGASELLGPIILCLLSPGVNGRKKHLLQVLTLLFQKGDAEAYLQALLDIPRAVDAIMVRPRSSSLLFDSL